MIFFYLSKQLQINTPSREVFWYNEEQHLYYIIE